jgi:DNA-binding IclR family transcriptional regulator
MELISRSCWYFPAVVKGNAPDSAADLVCYMNLPVRVTTEFNDLSARTETPGAQTLRRGLAILKLLARYQPAGLRISDIGRRLGLNKATAVRLTQALVDERFVVHDAATRCYRLGPETFAIGLAAEPGYTLQRLATESLRALALETGDWVFFSVLQGFEAICISRETGDMPIPPDALRLGDRHPLGVGAGGLALLAALPDDEVEEALAANGRAIEEHFPRMPVQVIRRLMAETRERGYSVIPGIVAPGFWALGVPLLQPDGRPVAAIVLVSAEGRLHPTRRAVLGARMQSIARDVMARAQADSGR